MKNNSLEPRKSIFRVWLTILFGLFRLHVEMPQIEMWIKGLETETQRQIRIFVAFLLLALALWIIDTLFRLIIIYKVI
jgi:uncharacterized membrane protein YvlD (DUF360 family)